MTDYAQYPRATPRRKNRRVPRPRPLNIKPALRLSRLSPLQRTLALSFARLNRRAQ